MNLLDCTYEELAHALYLKGEQDGYQKVTDKTKWREPVMAEKLGHVAHTKISAGKDSDKYGSDAYDAVNDIFAEYKTQAIEDKQVRNLLQKIKNAKNGTRYAPLKVTGVYNGAYTNEAVDAYEKIDHYFGVFYKEKCVLIVRPNTDVVIGQLREELDRRQTLAKKSTNLNSATIDLGDETTYTVVYRDEEFFNQKG